MKIVPWSDLHLGGRSSQETRLQHADISDLTENDVVILAGDIFDSHYMPRFVTELDTPAHKIFVPGNHEYYGNNLQLKLERLRAYNGYKKLHVLDNNEVLIGGVRFLGATLWTDFELYRDNTKEAAMNTASYYMNDFRMIGFGHGNRRFKPEDSVELHQQAIAFLREKLNQNFTGKTVVITHHAPSFKSVHPRFADDLLSAAFTSNLDFLVELADLWVHGHMHDSFDYKIGKCRVICNPRGYMRMSGTFENEMFDPNIRIEI